VPIIRHPDVRRLLMQMRAHTEAARAIAYVAAGWNDVAHHHPDAGRRKQAKAIYEYLVPIVKGWSTEMSIQVASFGVQVHGGMGFIEETGAAQYYRDARILTIYEGTTAIQANDFVGRKTVRDGGAVAQHLLGEIRATADTATRAGGDLGEIGRRLAAAADAYQAVVEFVVDRYKTDIRAAFAASVPYLMLAGVVHGGWQMARAAQVAARRLNEGAEDADFLRAKIATARFFAEHVMSAAPGLRDSATSGAASTLALSDEQF
jgi:hypothetical protein